jgi:hypothetical protein
MFKMFLFILFIATCFGLSDGHPQENRRNYSKEVAITTTATNRKVAGSIPDEVNFLNLPHPSGRTRPCGLLSF